MLSVPPLLHVDDGGWAKMPSEDCCEDWMHLFQRKMLNQKLEQLLILQKPLNQVHQVYIITKPLIH